MGIIDRILDVIEMFFGSFLQLLGAMFQRSLAQEVQHLTAGLTYPIDRSLPVHESKHLHLMQMIASSRPFANHANGLHLSIRHTSRGHLHPINLQVFQQRAGNHQFFMRHKRYSAGLFTIAEGCIHDFYFDAFSHASILSLLATRKSMSSNPFIRQCFL